MRSYLPYQQVACSTLENFELFKKIKEKSYIYIYIDDNWIQNVAKLSYLLSGNEIQQIYKVYGDLNTIKRAFNSSINEMTEDNAESAYSIMFLDLCKIAGEPPNIDVSLRADIESIMNKLKKLSGIR